MKTYLPTTLLFSISLILFSFFSFQQPNQSPSQNSKQAKQFQKETTAAFIALSFADSIFNAGQSQKAAAFHTAACLAFEKCLVGIADSLIWTKILDCRQKKGISLMYLGKYKEALTTFKNSLEKGKTLFGETHSVVGEGYSNIGAIHYYQSNYSKAVQFMQKGLTIYVAANGAENKDVAMIYANISILHSFMGQYDSVLIFSQKALNIRNKIFEPPHADIAWNYFDIAHIYQNLGNYEKAEEHALKALKMRQELFPDGHVDIFYTHSSLANIFERQGLYPKALKFHHKALEGFLIELGEKHIHTIATFNNIGACHHLLGAYEKGLEYSTKALDLILNVDNDHHRVADIYRILGKLSNGQKQYDKANNYFKKGLILQRKILQKGHIEIANTLQGIGDTYLKSEDFNAALRFFEMAKSELEISFDANHSRLAQVYEKMARVAFQKNQLTLALNLNEKALKIFKQNRISHHPFLSSCYLNLSEIYTQQLDFVNAKTACQKGLNALNLSLNLNEENDFSDISKIKIIGELIFLKLILEKGKMLKKWAENSNNSIEKFEEALKTIEFGTQLVNQIRKTYHRNSAKENLFEKAQPIYQLGVEICFQLWKKTTKEIYLHKAFEFAEKNKSNLLLEALQNATAKKFAGIPDSLIQKEKEVKLRLANYEQKLAEADFSSADSTKKILWENIVVQSKQELDLLIQQFEQNHPKYFQLKYQFLNQNLKGFQSILKPQTTCLEYFLTDSTLFTLIIERDKISVKKIPLDFELNKSISDFQNGIFSYHLSLNQTSEIYQTYNQLYTQTAHQLYQKLIKPLGDLPKNLIIIPDGQLGYIPFDALLTELPEHPERFKNHQYLARKHNISYCYSASLLEEMWEKNGKNSEKNWLGVAPYFEGEPIAYRSIDSLRGSLHHLKYNLLEVQAIQKITDGKTLSNIEASKENFLKNAPNFSILHLATHAKSEDQQSHFSWLAFTETPDSNLSNKLYINDLYNLDLNADLVVLSACETGIGKLITGEGIQSLARGFSYAGASSILTTLWAVNDETTKNIMENFYQNLKSGLPKDAALQQAKMNYLASIPNDRQAHPFFWASYIPIGDMENIEFKSGFGWRIWMVIGLVILVFLLNKIFRIF